MADWNWTAIGAVGQLLCAVATFWAVFVALKPFRRKLSVKFDFVAIRIGDETQNCPMRVRVYNRGGKKCEVTGWGVIGNGIRIGLGKEPVSLDSGEMKSFLVGFDSLAEALDLIESKDFRFYVDGNQGTSYCSKKLHKEQFAANSKISDMMK